MCDFSVGMVTHTRNRYRAINLENCQRVTIPAESEVEITKREKIKIGYLCTVKWQGNLFEIPSTNLYTQKEWETFSFLKTELAKRGAI